MFLFVNFVVQPKIMGRSWEEEEEEEDLAKFENKKNLKISFSNIFGYIQRIMKSIMKSFELKYD